MDMQINSGLIKQERERRAWSQQQLAEVSGLSVRTVQRVEISGVASYDTVQALASVFELSIESLTLANALPSSKPAANNKNNLKHLFRLLGSSLSGALITLVAFLLFSSANAEQIFMDVSYSMAGKNSDVFSIANEVNEEAEFTIDDTFRLVVVPEVMGNGNIMLTFAVYEKRHDQYQLISKPKIITGNEQLATIVVNDKEVNELTLHITPFYNTL